MDTTRTERFLRLPQVLEIVPVCRSTWWAGIRNGIFPRGVKLSTRTTAWRASDIAELVERLGARQENPRTSA